MHLSRSKPYIYSRAYCCAGVMSVDCCKGCAQKLFSFLQQGQARPQGGGGGDDDARRRKIIDLPKFAHNDRNNDRGPRPGGWGPGPGDRGPLGGDRFGPGPDRYGPPGRGGWDGPPRGGWDGPPDRDRCVFMCVCWCGGACGHKSVQATGRVCLCRDVCIFVHGSTRCIRAP